MVHLIFIAFILFYILISIWQFFNIKTLDDFFIRSRSLSLRDTTSSLVLTQLGSSMILDTARKGFEFGIFGFFYPIGVSIGLLLLTSKIANEWRSRNIRTTAEIFHTEYGSVSLRKFAAMINLISLMGILLAQAITLKTIICRMYLWLIGAYMLELG